MEEHELSKESVIEILVERDGISEGEAKQLLHDWLNGEFDELISLGSDSNSICESFTDEFGLEADYLFELI